LLACDSGSSPTGSNGDDTGGGPGDGGGSPPAFDSRAAPGDSARSFLANDNFDVLAVEVDYMSGYAPTSAGLNDLRSGLVEHVDKSSVTIPAPTEIAADGQSTYTTADVQGLEEEHRDRYTETESDTLWTYVLIVDGTFEQENVVGAAYFNTSHVFFGATIDEISGGLTQPSQAKVEATVFRHEFGHNLGLVNNGTEMQQDHQDDPNGRHCTNDQCVMYYAIETTDFFANAFDGSVPSFESFCTEDMAAVSEE
jgi:hypothetical protein